MQKTTFHTPPKDRLDASERPQDNFFGFVANKWLASNPIPASESRWGVFSILRDEAWQHMRELYDELDGKKVAEGSVEQQARDFYHTGLHFNELEPEHLRLVHEYLAKIDTLQNASQLPTLIGELQKIGVDVLWRLVIDADDKDSSRHLLRFMQPRLTLPDRDYYLTDNAEMREIRSKFQEHVARVAAAFPALGASAETVWQQLWDLELAIATVNRSREARRDIEKNYHKITFAQLQQTHPEFDWQAYATATGWHDPTDLSNDQPEVLAFVVEQLGSRSLDTWKLYLKWQFLMRFAAKVSQRFAEMQFEFFGKVLGGTQELMPVWKRVVLTMDSAMGEAVGRLYAERHFPESSKQQVLNLVEDIRAAYKTRLQNLDWMSQPTRQTALKKLANIKVLIGYPDKWRDFSGLQIGRTSYIGNIIAAEVFSGEYYFAKLRRPTSRDDWFMDPQMVNAYHDHNRLVICFPAAILQAPFFDPQAHPAVNIGAIGAVIGHEFSHGFDDQGCQFDPDGNVAVWQTPEERAEFSRRADVIIHQADAFEVLPGLNLKGKLVIGESIADLAGIELALEALKQKFADLKAQTDAGLSVAELFFVSFAMCEVAATREQAKRQITLSDPHPDERFRVNGMLAHVADFYETYNVGPADKLYRKPAERAKIW